MKSNLRLVLAAAVSAIALDATAGGFAVREQSTTAQGFSFAGAATSAAGLSSMYWNPAAVASMPGINTESHYSLILGHAKMTPTTGSGVLTAGRPGTGDIGIPAFVPSTYMNYQLNDQIYVGFSLNSPFGLKTKSDVYNAAQFYGRSSKATNIVGTPTIGYKVNDWLTVAAGVQIGYLDVSLKQATPSVAGAAGVPTAFLPTAPTSELQGDGWGAGYTLGATIKPLAGTEIGIGFRSSIHYGLKGNFTAPGTSIPLKTSVNTPEIFTVGLKQRITDDFSLVAGYEWTNWSRIRSPSIVNRNTGVPFTELAFHYKDAWMVSLGGEYKWNEYLTLRTGIAYEKSPISDAVRNVRIPDNDRIWASLGATYNYSSRLSFDVAYTHIWVKNPDVRIAAGNPAYNPLIGPASAFVANGKAHVDIISVGLKYRWDEPPVRRAAITKG